MHLLVVSAFQKSSIVHRLQEPADSSTLQTMLSLHPLSERTFGTAAMGKVLLTILLSFQHGDLSCIVFLNQQTTVCTVLQEVWQCLRNHSTPLSLFRT